MTAVELKCPNCAAANPTGSRFCSSCGASLGDAAPHQEAKQCIEQYGGVLEKFIGDAVMAVFGAPVAHGDDAERAVRAGLRVLEGIAELGLPARAAVNTGDALVSVEHARSGGALATGDVVNTASRLQTAAPPGRLVVGVETYRGTRNVIRYEELEPV